MRLLAPWSKATCLFCFHRFHLNQAPRRVVSGGSDAPDEVLARFLNRPPQPMGEVIPPPRRSLLKRLLGSMVLGDDPPNQKKICPKCHMYLTSMISAGELSGEGFAIIGALDSGKSNYFGVLLNALEKRYCDDVGFTMFDQETFDIGEMKQIGSRATYARRYGRFLFNKTGAARIIDKTLRIADNPDVRIPLIYRLQFRKRGIQHLTRPLARVRAMDLAVFDAAGEDMDNKQVIEELYPFILRAKGIIFLIDPFQYRGLRDRLPPDMQARVPLVDGDPADIVSKVRQLFEEKRLVKAGQKISIPVAFALSKADMLRGLVYRGSPILRDSEHKGGYNRADCEEVSRQLIEYIKRWDTVELINKAEGLFSNFKFFAVSALGTSPGKDRQLSKVEPTRVADPLLWLLHQRGYIGTMPSARG